MNYDTKQVSTALKELHKSNDVSDAAYSTLKFAIEQLTIPFVVESALTPEDLTIFAKWVDDHFYTHRLKILPRELEKFYIENRESIVKQYS